MWHDITFVERVGVAEPLLGTPTRSIFYCAMTCGHTIQVHAMTAPLKGDCMRCSAPAVQLALPFHIPAAVEPPAPHGWPEQGTSLIDEWGV